MKSISVLSTKMMHPVNGTENFTNTRQPRFYGPLLGFVLANLLSNSAIAKFAPLGALRVSYNPNPWISYSNPIHEHHDHHEHPIHHEDSHWKPITPATEHPTHSQEPQHLYHYHHHVGLHPSQQQIINIRDNDKPPVEIDIQNNDQAFEDEDAHDDSSITDRPDADLIPAESNIRRNVVKPNSGNRRYVDNLNNRQRNKLQNGRRRFSTTTENSNLFYDNYDEYENDYSDYRINRFTPKNKIRSTRRPSYYDDSEDDDDYSEEDYDLASKPSKKSKHPTLSKKTKHKNKRKSQANSQTSTEDFDESTERVTAARQRQTTTMTPNTQIINGSTPTPNNTNTTTNTTGYGYGPSNGNEMISITYGPPSESYSPYQPRPSYGPPRPSYGPPSGSAQYHFADWYNNQESPNSAIVRKVHDVIGFDNIFQQRKFN